MWKVPVMEYRLKMSTEMRRNIGLAVILLSVLAILGWNFASSAFADALTGKRVLAQAPSGGDDPRDQRRRQQQQQQDKKPEPPPQRGQSPQVQQPVQQIQPPQVQPPTQPAQRTLPPPPQQPVQQIQPPQIQQSTQPVQQNKPPQIQQSTQPVQRTPPPPSQQLPQQTISPQLQQPSTLQQVSRPGFDRGPRNVEELRSQRHERVEDGGRRIIEEPGRFIVRDNDRSVIRHDETARFFRSGGAAPRIERMGAEIRTVYIRPDGVQIITVTDANGRLLRRIRRDPGGREFILIDNSIRNAAMFGAVGAAALITAYYLMLPPPVIMIPRREYIVEYDMAAPPDLYGALMAPPLMPLERAYALDEIRYNYNLRARMRRVVINTVNFEFGAWEISPDQVGRLEAIAMTMLNIISRNPNEVFLIEGHTDAVGFDVDNLSLSDRRAESIANILSDVYGVPPENLVTQGYGEQFLLVPTPGPERINRRVEVMRITPLLAGR